MDLADDGMIVALDGYLDLMPDIVAAVGEEHMDAWRSSDGHIYTIPSISTVQGSFSMLVRRDWLEALKLDVPESWSDGRSDAAHGRLRGDAAHSGDGGFRNRAHPHHRHDCERL